MFLANFSLLVNTFLTPLTVYAQDATPVTDPAPTEQSVTPPAEETPAPPAETTPAPEETTPAPEEVSPITAEEVTTTPSPNETTPTPSEEVTPTPGETVEGATTETSNNEVTEQTEETTVVEAVTNEENATVEAIVVENVDAASVTEEEVVYDGTGTPQLQTDKADYAPTDVVLITGTGFEVNKEYDLVITGTGDFRFDDKVKSDESGAIFYTYQLDGTYRPDYKVEILDNGSSVSSVTFLDATVFFDGFGTGSTDSTFDESPVWTEGGSGAEKREIGSGNETASADGGRFAKIEGGTGYICRTISATGYNSVQLSYYWRGDSDSGDNSDDGIVEFKSASGNSCGDSSGWTQLQNHDLRTDSSWSTQSAFANAGFNNTSFLLRFRTASNSSSDDFRVDGISVAGTAIASPTLTPTPTPLPDLVAVKANNVGGTTTVGGVFTWTFTVTNIGLGTATFTNNQDILQDNMPDSGATYSPTSNLAVTNSGGTTGSIDCDIVNDDDIDCDASGVVTIPAGGSFSFSVTVTPTAPGTLVNPRGGPGEMCYVDPDNVVMEDFAGNNGCGDTVVVETDTGVPNPSLPQACGLDIALILDNSTSIDSGEMTSMKSAMTAFTTALNGTPTQFSVSRFATTASVVQAFTGNITDVNNAINGIPVGGGFTNWEDGLLKGQSTLPNRVNPDLVIFSSDGNPNRVDDGSSSVPETQAVTEAVLVANSIKTGGARILALGIGSDLDTPNLQAVSGPNVNTGNVLTSDVITTNFANLASQLATFASQTCGGTITAQKLIDADGNLQTTNDQTPAEGWTFDVSGTPSDPAPSDTDAQGFTPAIPVDPGMYSITETPESGYSLLSASCTLNQQSAGSPITNGVGSIQVGSNDIVSCTFINTPNVDLPPYICHATGNPNNWVQNFPANIGQLMGHADNGHQDGNDIIPPIDAFLPLGWNWNAQTEAIWNNQCSIPETDVKITKTDSPDPVTSGGELTYTLTVNNESLVAADNVVVTDSLPGVVLSIVSVVPSQGACSDTSLPSPIACQLGTIAASGSATVTVKVIVSGTGVIENTANVTTTTSETDLTDNEDKEETTVVDLPSRCEQGVRWATSISGATQGLRKNGTAVLPARSIPASVLGVPNATTGPDSGFYSLGKGGSVTVAIANPVVNGAGTDISIHEVTNGRETYPLETASVEVFDGSWHSVGTALSTSPSGVTYLDIAPYTNVTMIRITDTTNFALNSDPNADGFDVDAVDVDCKSTITVNKNLDTDADGKVDETNTQGWTWDLNGAGNFPMGSTQDVLAGSYALSEDDQAGYHFLQLYCNDVQQNGPTPQVTVGEGSSVVCTYTNVRDTGNVKVNKRTDANGDGDWNDTGEGLNGSASNAFYWTLDTIGPNTFGDTVNNVTTGSHDVNENSVAGYHFTGWYVNGEQGRSCTNPNGTTLPSTISIVKGQTKEITLCNQRDKGTIVIVKEAIPTSEDNFSFDTVSGFPGGDFELEDDGNDNNGGTEESKTISVLTGQYWVKEDGESGWALTDLVCSDGQSQVPSTVNLGERKATINVEAGETVTCTFTNKKLAKLIIKKETLPNNSNKEFDFTRSFGGGFDLEDGDSRTFENLTPGNYTVTEVGENGWVLQSVVCSDQTQASEGSVTVNLDYNETVTCTFNNMKLGKIEGYKFNDKNADGDKDTFEARLNGWRMFIDENDNGTYDDGEPSDTTSGQFWFFGWHDLGEYGFDNLMPGTYKVCEELQNGWTASTPVCQTTVIHANGGDEDDLNFGNYRPLTLGVYKVLCENEADLPNWGAGGPNINANTAQDWVEEHESCRLVADWAFQYGFEEDDANKYGSGDQTGSAPAPWTVLGTTDADGYAEVSITSPKAPGGIWVREVLPSDEYVPFSYPPAGPEENDFSAELYCHKDVNNYDNYDLVDDPEFGETYYCVAFNALNNGDLQVCKYDDYDGDGKKDEGEPGIPGVTISVSTEGEQQAAVVSVASVDQVQSDEVTLEGDSKETGEDGCVIWEKLDPGNYNVSEELEDLPGYIPTADYVNGSSDDGANGETVAQVKPGQTTLVEFLNELQPVTITLEKAADEESTGPGDIIFYTLKVKNTSDHTAYDASVSDFTPFGFVYQTGSTEIDDVASEDPSISGPVLNWTLGTLTPGQEVKVEYRMKAPDPLSEGTYTNIALAVAYNRPSVEVLEEASLLDFLVTEVNAITPHPDASRAESQVAFDVVKYTKGVSFSASVGGQVLGASTVLGATLPASGSETYILLALLSTLSLGIWFKFLSVKDGKKN